MRCNDCNKFVRNGDLEVEVDANINVDGTIDGASEITILCSECGTGIGQCSFEIDNASLIGAVEAHRKEAKEAFDKKFFEAVSIAFAAAPNLHAKWTHDRNGKPIIVNIELGLGNHLNVDLREEPEHELEIESESEGVVRTEGEGRGAKTFYGYRSTHTVTCSCGYKFGSVETSDDMQSKGMEKI